MATNSLGAIVSRPFPASSSNKREARFISYRLIGRGQVSARAVVAQALAAIEMN